MQSLIRGAGITMMAVQVLSACTGQGAPAPRPSPTQPRPWVLEQSIEHRWLNEGQKPEFTPMGRASSPLLLDLAEPSRRIFWRTIRIAMPGSRGDSSTVTVDGNGKIVRLQTWFQPVPAPVMLPGDSARMTRARLLVGGYLVLPYARVWDLVPEFHPRRVILGARWRDTIDLSTDYEGSEQTLTGWRTSVLVGDTVYAGVPVWIVRDSAHVRYTERELQYERTLDTLVAIERSATGTIVGTYLFDPTIEFLGERNDTTTLIGTAVLQYPDGRVFSTPTRYERTRRWTLYDPGAFQARQAERMLERLRTSSGPVRSPSNELERRLASGDARARDSLIGAWEREPNADRREELYRLLLVWGGAALRSDLEARREAAGDTAFLLRRLAERAYPAQPPMDVDAVQRLIRVMSDPGLSFKFGASRDALYENLVQTFTTWPRALAPDTTRARCAPEACALLEDQWRTAEEPRLRDVGLAALATRDPVRWADSAIARVAAGSTVLIPVAQLANGVGATWPAAAKLPIPAPGADWRDWLAWASAPNPAYRPPPGMQRSLQSPMRFEEEHARAIRFYERRTGRDVVGELRRQRAAATDDSARMVYGMMLNGLGDRPSAEELAAQFRSGSPAQIALAQRALPSLFGLSASFDHSAPRSQNRQLADSATTVAILDRLIATTVDGGEPWPSLVPRRDGVPPPSSAPVESPRVAPYVLADSVPPALRARWRDHVRFIGPNDWRSMPDREAATLLTLSSVQRVGPFLMVRTHNSGRLARQPNETPHLFYGGATYFLLATDNGWSIVLMDMWIT